MVKQLYLPQYHLSKSFRRSLVDIRKEFYKLFHAQDTKISQMSNEINILKLKIGKVKEKVEQNDSYQWRDTLFFLQAAPFRLLKM